MSTVFSQPTSAKQIEVFAKRKVVAFSLLLFLVWTSSAAAQNYLKPIYDTDGKEVLKAFAPVVADARRSVVQIYGGSQTPIFGTIVTADGLVLTKASDVRGGDANEENVQPELTVRLADGRRVAAQFLSEDRLKDLALIQLEADGLTPITFDIESQPRLGQWVVVPGLGESPEAVGVMSALARQVNPVRLGIQMARWPFDERPVIAQTLPGMGAEAAGLQRGDVLVSVNGNQITESQDVIDAIQDVIVGDVIEVVVERHGESMIFAVEMKLPEINLASRTDRMNVMGNDVSTRRDGFASVLQHDATLTPAECGGPLLNLDGRCIGINIARAGRIEAYTLPAEVVVQALAELTDQVLVRDAEPASVDH